MQILNIAGYRFIALDNLLTLQNELQQRCASLDVKGTILLSPEGININFSGVVADIISFKAYLLADERFAGMSFHEFYSDSHAFKRLKIKIKNEIITFRQSQNVSAKRASSVTPAELKQWLDENRDITLLDTRNDFEVNMGTFKNAVNLHLQHFTEFKDAVKQVDTTKPVVMFCTGGIRCEKAALYMQDQGFNEVYQLDGGILGYFNNVGGAHYTGDCFVFDERVVVSPSS